MTKDGDAVVAPNQPWTQDGTAVATPLLPFPDTDPRTLPLDNRGAGNFTVRQSEYPIGLVVVWTGHEPSTSPATLPIKASDGDDVRITGENAVEWPDGVVIWFTSD